MSFNKKLMNKLNLIDNGKYIRQKDIHEDLEIKIAAYINEMLTQAIEEEEKKKQHVKD